MIKKYKEIWIPFVCFCVLATLLLLNVILPVDLWVYDKIAHIIHDPLTTVFKIVTFLGETKTIVVLSILWIFFLWKKDTKEIKPFLLLMLLSLCCIVILKLIFARERPDILRLITIDGYSFPSGHSLISASFYGYLATYCAEQKRLYKWLLVIFCLIIVGIGFSRIYLGVHYFSDVLAGFSVGACILGIVNFIRRKDSKT